jgi:hypothetical protein
MSSSIALRRRDFNGKKALQAQKSAFRPERKWTKAVQCGLQGRRAEEWAGVDEEIRLAIWDLKLAP